MFTLTGRIFHYRNVDDGSSTYVGFIGFDKSEVTEIKLASYDSDADDNFFLARKGGVWELYSNVTSGNGTSEVFDVPVLFEYIDHDGNECIASENYVVYGASVSMLYPPTIKYVENLATKIGTSAEVVIHGTHIDDSMDVFLWVGDETIKIPHDEIEIVHHAEDGSDDTVTFVMSPDYAIRNADGDEICATYGIGIGIGDAEDGSHDIITDGSSMESNIGLIRYRYDSSNAEANKTAAAGAVASTNKACFYQSEISVTYDSVDPVGNTYTDGGKNGKYGDTMYVRMGPGQDCHAIRYIRVKLKYNKRLERLRGEQVLDGVQLYENDIVWLAAQMDDTEGLWIVKQGEWLGLETYLETEESYVDYEHPCTAQKQVPLAVDYTVFPDLGATVNDTVTLSCSSNVPVKNGSQYVCGRMVVPGDILLLTNQTCPEATEDTPEGCRSVGDSKVLNLCHEWCNDGIWEVTCSDWIYRGSVGIANGTTVNQSESILFQNDIDFCKCGIYHIWYYYLNGGCYLATATRTVKVICAGASIVPNNNVVITDYKISTGTDDELVNVVTGTAGDPVQEDCVRSYDDETVDNATYNAKHGMSIKEYTVGCGEDSPTKKAPDCSLICDCPRYYTVDFGDDYVTSKDSEGFTILFWQYGDGGWNLYAYIGEGNNKTGMNYYVYSLHCNGVATRDKVDINADVEYRIKNADGIYTTERTRDAWFVEHGGTLANDFGIVDDSWNFYEIDENGDRKMTYKHVLDAETLYQQWSIKCTSLILAHRDYAEPATELNRRTTCADMDNPAKDAACHRYISGTEHIYGFKYYRTALSIDRFCDIYNDYTCVIGDTWLALATDVYFDEELGRMTQSFIVTDQCYDSHGNECDCDEAGAQHAYIEV